MLPKGARPGRGEREAVERPALRRTLRGALRQIGLSRLAATALVLLFALLFARFSWSIPLADFAERALYDVRAALTAPRLPQDKRITLIVYTDDTLRRLQKRSPLDRALLAKALATLDGMQPKAIGIDILIDQPQAEDPQLIQALRAMRTPTYLALATAEENGSQVDYEQEQYIRAFQARIAGTNARPASIRLQTDRDNVVREWPVRPATLPPLLADAMTGASSAFRDYSGAIAFRLPAQGDTDAFAKVPIELFADPAFAEALRPVVAGRYLLIGGDINDIDQFVTPDTWRSNETMIGLEVHAQMLAQLLDGNRLTPIPPPAFWLSAFVVVLAASVTSVLDLRSWAMALLLAAQLAFVVAFPLWLARVGVDTIGLRVVGWGVGWILAFAAVGAAARAVGSEQRRFAQSALGKYLPVDIANQIMRDPDRLALHGEKRQIYALFSDLEGFTKLSHAIAPEMVATLLNRYLDTLSAVVLAHGGTIDKFVGDAVVAFWGAPIARPDDADRATQAAIALFEAGERFRREAPEGVPPIGCTRVGLHRGEAIVGNFGGEGRMQYTALGDSMNTAARLESANKQLDTTVLVSAAAAAETTLGIFRPLGRIVVSGRSTPIELFEPVPQITAAEREMLETIYTRFDSGDASALEDLEKYAASHPDDAAAANMVYRLRTVGPGGSFVLDHK